MSYFHASRECVEALNRYCGSSLSYGVTHVQALHNHDNDHLDWFFQQNIFPLRDSTFIMSGNGKGFTLEELFRSPFTEFLPSFPFSSIENFFQSLVDGLLNVFFFSFKL